MVGICWVTMIMEWRHLLIKLSISSLKDHLIFVIVNVFHAHILRYQNSKKFNLGHFSLIIICLIMIKKFTLGFFRGSPLLGKPIIIAYRSFNSSLRLVIIGL